MNIFESNAPEAGQRGTETAHRKIELQDSKDLGYLISNVSRAAREKIDKHLPPDAAPESGEDEMRRRVEALVDEYIRNTFAAAKDGMSINGMDTKEMEAELAKAQDGEEIEPFDAKLAQRVQALSAQIESQTLQLANVRRNAPAETARKYDEAFAKQSADYENNMRKQEEEALAAARASKLDIGEVERLDEMQGTWQKGTEELGELKTRLGGTVAKMERAQKAVEYVDEKH